MTNTEKLHKHFNTLRRFSFPFNANEIPKNGIYIFFEKGETYKSYDRIVRVGTHTGQNNLPVRLKEHLVKENKDRSIFRKNIGRAILNKANDPFLLQWNIDLTTRKNREKYSALIDFQKLENTEKEVSAYMRENFSFCVIPIETKDDRLHFEECLKSASKISPLILTSVSNETDLLNSPLTWAEAQPSKTEVFYRLYFEGRIISTLAHDADFKSSGNWLGRFSPESEISESGLWLKKGLTVPQLTDEETEFLINIK